IGDSDSFFALGFLGFFFLGSLFLPMHIPLHKRLGFLHSSFHEKTSHSTARSGPMLQPMPDTIILYFPYCRISIGQIMTHNFQKTPLYRPSFFCNDKTVGRNTSSAGSLKTNHEHSAKVYKFSPKGQDQPFGRALSLKMLCSVLIVYCIIP